MHSQSWLSFGSRVLWCGLVVAVFGLSGCSSGEVPDPTASVSGKVTFQGAAVSEGMVNFYDSKRGNAASVKLGADGSYSIESVVLGDYGVFITPLPVEVPNDATKPAPPQADPANIPAKYRDVKTSDLKTAVKAGSNKAEFDMVP